jgi:hypothetical protein
LGFDAAELEFWAAARAEKINATPSAIVSTLENFA